jgi:hypothetical protein
MLKDLTYYLDHVMARPGYAASCLPATLPSFSCYYQRAGVKGGVLNRYQGHRYTLSWLLMIIAEPAASFSHPQLIMEGGIEGSMALLPTTQGVIMPSTSSAHPSLPTHPTTTASSPAPSPPSTTGERATAEEHHTAMTLFCWVRRIQFSCWFIQQRQRCPQALCPSEVQNRLIFMRPGSKTIFHLLKNLIINLQLLICSPSNVY